ncbi:serine-aspartate repeat-containing protein I-like [Haliotis rubra]|uniref:serine-aspartate repeat-containing protein I-like n=1 Tax=Haliotis rubra TaxID=36100 RepID=UPI001EE5A2E0|nr:serine-aspartate repeat-containing protein I-like [Haliotis rubra]
MLQPSTHIGAGDTRTDGGDVYKGDAVNDVAMSLLRNVCDAEVVTEQQVGKDATEGLGSLADKTMPTDNMSENEREGSDAITSSSSIAGSASSDTMPESTADNEFSVTIPPESTAESEYPDTTPPESTAESEFQDTIPPESTAESEFSDTIPPESAAECEFPDTIPPESTAESEFPNTIPPESVAESEFPDTLPPESTAESVPSKCVSTADCEASDIVTLISSVVGTAVSDTMPDSTAEMESSILGTAADSELSYTVSESTAEAELSYTVSDSAAEGESSDTIPPGSTAERESSMPAYTATPEGELSYAVFESSTESESSDSIAVSSGETESRESVATDESELSDTVSEGTAKRESDTVPLSIFERESSSYTIPDSTGESEPSYTTFITTTEGEASDKAISLAEGGPSDMKPISVAEVFSEVESQPPHKMTVALVDDITQFDQANPPVLYLECIEALDATSSTDSGTVAVMFGRDVDPAGSISQEDSYESERDSEWPEATLSVSDKYYSGDDVVSCPQQSPSPLEASDGILRLSYSSPCVLVTSRYRAPPPDGAEPSCPVDQGLEEESNSSSSSSEALICRPSGDASELYASDVSFVYDDEDDDEYDESDGDVEADDVHYDAGDGLENSVDADDNACVGGNAVIWDNVNGKGNSISEDVDPCDLESGVAEVDADANSAYVCDDVEVDNYDNVDNAVDAAGGVDFHVNFEADFDADAITNVKAYVKFGVSADAVSGVDAVAYSVDAGVGSNVRVDVDADIDDSIDSDAEVKVCVALHVELDADPDPHSDVEDDGDVDVGLAADVGADDSDTEVEAGPVDADPDIDAVSDTNIEYSVPTDGDDGVSSTGDMDGRYNYRQQQQQQHQQQQQPVIITNIDGPAVTSSVSVATTSSTTGGSRARGNAHFLLDKSYTDSDLDISVINLDNEPPNPDPFAHIDTITDNPPSESSSTDTLQFSSLISESDFEVPCQTRPDTSNSTASQISPGLREGCYVS